MTATNSATPAPDATLLLIDGHSMAYRAFYALPADAMRTSSGQHTNAVYGFCNMLASLITERQPTHVAVAFDLGRDTFRLAEYPEYKATRSKSPDEFKGQVDLVREVLAAANVTVVDAAGFEADDVIATLATAGEAAGLDVLVCSGDRDSLQLVTDKVTVLYPVKGVSQLDEMTPARVEEKFLVPPANYPDLAALVGETSDNLPGVPKVGPKTAAKWITKYGTVADILDHAEDVKGKIGENLRAHVDDVRRNRKLNALVRDVELTIGVEDTLRQSPDKAALAELLDTLEIQQIRAKLVAAFSVGDADGEAGEDAADAGPQITVVDASELAAWLEANTGVLGVAVQPESTYGRDDITHVTLATTEEGLHLEVTELDEATDQALAAAFADQDRQWVAHDSKSLRHSLGRRGYDIAGRLDDTLIGGYLLRPDARNYGLDDLAGRYAHVALPEASATPAGELDLGVDPVDNAAFVQRAAVLPELAKVLRDHLARDEQTSLVDDIELPVADTLYAMEAAGVAVDRDYLTGLIDELTKAVEQEAQSCYRAIDREVNLGSPKQLQDVLFNQLDMPKTRKIKTGYSTNADALVDLHTKTQHPFLEHLLRHRDVTRQRVTVEGLLKAIEDDGRIRTRFSQVAAATGRLSSTEPNLQNIPIRTEEGRRIRDAFTVGEGFDHLVAADYSQIEMRIMAHGSKDEGLIEAFRSGEDLHSYVGSKVFDCAPEDITAAQRSKVKAMSYGLAYGLSAFGLSKQLKISTGEASDLMDMYFERFGGVKRFLEEIVVEARKNQYTQTLFGRRRYLPDLLSDNRQRREMAERMALNSPIQGTAADIIKIAMVNVAKALQDAGLTSRLLLQVHDELIVETVESEHEQVKDILTTHMAAAAELTVPLDIHLGWGKTWNSAGH